jgi:hypothetical protein
MLNVDTGHDIVSINIDFILLILFLFPKLTWQEISAGLTEISA